MVALAITGGIAFAVACSYRPIALWWVMVGCSALNLVRFVARLSGDSRRDPSGEVPTQAPLVTFLSRLLTRSLDTLAGGRSAASKASLDRQHARFLIWFAEHNLLWTTIGFGVSLLLWHRFGPTTSALVVMAALMSCGLFAALGAAVGARSPTLGLCWREPCRTPDFRSLRRLVHDIGCVIVLARRRDYAARRDWEKGGRFHELFLTVDDLARAGVEPRIEAVLSADDPTARRALARKERVDRALALTPVFVAGLLAAVCTVPSLAGSEPLPSLWTIVTKNTNTSGGSARTDDPPRDLPAGGGTTPDSRQAQKTGEQSPTPSASRAEGDTTSNQAPSGSERPDLTGPSGQSSITGDAVASAGSDGGEAAGQRGTGQGQGAGGDGAPGSGDASSSNKNGSGTSGGRGGGPRGYGTGGPAPQRAESPSAIPDVPRNPGKAIELVLPAFAEARDDSGDDDPTGVKRKATAAEQARAAQGRTGTTPAAGEPATRQPIQRLPNWVFTLLRK